MPITDYITYSQLNTRNARPTMCALYKGKQIWIFVGGGWQAGVFMSLPTPNAWMHPSTHGRAVSCARTRALAATSKDSAYKNVLFVLFRLIRKNERWQTKPETILLLLSTVLLCPALMKRIAQTHARTTRARARSDAHAHKYTRVSSSIHSRNNWNNVNISGWK